MAMIRITHNNFEKIYKAFGADTYLTNEWEDDTRVDENAWILRYKHEASLIGKYIIEYDCNTILEIGSGPGTLAKYIFEDIAISNAFEKTDRHLTYHMLDKKYAKESHTKRKYPGELFVNDLNDGIDTHPLLDEGYDFIICNDVLEHLSNPTQIMQQLYHLNSGKNKMFISIPNWRMAHQMTYRGLWDYDNFLYFMAIHGYEANSIEGSPLVTPHYPKLDSEEHLPDELLLSWNWYFTFNKNKDFLKEGVI